MPLPGDREISAMPILNVQEPDVMLGTEALPLPEAGKFGISAPSLAQTDSSTQELLGVNQSQPTDIAANPSAACGWKWGERAPSTVMDEEESTANTSVSEENENSPTDVHSINHSPAYHP
ncbi:hypothetical protein EI94DRAFT_1804128 [Lactarius quietus]|nr:hypothetical protein EI94DRAFT_1804128 [Lactarius quietus]